MRTKLAILIFLINCMAVLSLWGIMQGAIYLGENRRDSKIRNDVLSMTAGGGKASNIRLDKAVLENRKKFDAALESLKKKYRQITAADSMVYLKIPEAEFFDSFFSYFFTMDTLSENEVVLDDATVKQFKKQGILLYSMDKNYPFMKKSIFLDKRHKNFNIPRVRVGTNIIIVFVESLSEFFLRDDIHGVRGLTPNIKEMQRHSYSFTNMYNSAYPTIKGLIAALGSSIYLMDESIGGTRIRIPCRFLFLSDILRSLNYTTTHIQAGSERFIGMKAFFEGKEGYDNFYGSESIALKNIESLERGFGVNDTIFFNYVIDWLEQYRSPRPFLLTVQTVDMHPPFKVTDRNPNAGDSDLLNSIYSTDKAFGRFWSYFMKSKYRNNTLVILTADHAMGNNKDFVAFTNKFRDRVNPFFDLIPCFIYFPGGAWAGMKNGTPCYNLDIVPTLLDMMNLDLPNPFMGLSIFSERPYYKRGSVSMSEVMFELDEKGMRKARQLLGFYNRLYRTDRILPPHYKVRFN
jgi:phosphoglycerol transferase MdoB-like AlkP superfamily enzyme